MGVGVFLLCTYSLEAVCRRGKRPTPRTHMMCPYAGGLARCSLEFRYESSYGGICLSVLQLVPTAVATRRA